MDNKLKIDIPRLALAVSFISLSVAAWQAWKQRDTPLQALVYQNQMSTIQTMIENARIGCHRRICSDYANPEKEKMVTCRGDTLDSAFGKVQDATETLKLIASPELLDIAGRFRDANNKHALGDGDPIYKGERPNTEPLRFELFRKCEQEIDSFVNELRSTMGLAHLSSGLLSRIGEKPEQPPQRPIKQQ